MLTERRQCFCFSSLRFLNFFFNPCFKDRLHAVIWDLAGPLCRGQDGKKTARGRKKRALIQQSRSLTQRAQLLERASSHNVIIITDEASEEITHWRDKDGNANREKITGSRETSLHHL